MERKSGRGTIRTVAVIAAILAFTPRGGTVLAAGPAASHRNVVIIGIMPSETVKATLEKYQPLMDYLSKKTGMSFEAHPMKSYDGIIEHLKSGEIDGGIFGSFSARKAIASLGSVPLARPEKGGVSGYRGYVIVRKDGGYAKIQDLKGKSFDCVSRETSAGYVFPLALLRESRIRPDTFFSKMTFAGKHEIALAKVLNRESDGAAVKDTVFARLAKSDPRVNAELAVIHKSGLFPDGTVLFRKESPAPLTGAVKKALLGIDKDAAGRAALRSIGADRFLSTDKDDFAYLSKLVKQTEGK